MYFGGRDENDPERSPISDECYCYAKYNKNASTRACFFKKFLGASPIARV